MSRNKIGEDSTIPTFIYLKIQRRDGVESLTTLEEGEFKVPIDGCINVLYHSALKTKVTLLKFLSLILVVFYGKPALIIRNFKIGE